jgi:hypothetical protein
LATDLVAQLAERVTGPGLLDLYDLRPELGQQPSAERGCDEGRQVEHPHACKRAGCLLLSIGHDQF